MVRFSSSILTKSRAGTDGCNNFKNDSMYAGFFKSLRRGIGTFILFNYDSKLKRDEVESLFFVNFFQRGSWFGEEIGPLIVGS